MSCTKGGESWREGYYHKRWSIQRRLPESLPGAVKCSFRGTLHPFGACASSGAHGVRAVLRSSWRWIPGATCDTLKTCRQGADFLQEAGAHFHAQAHISTQSPQTREDARFPGTDEDQERGSRVEPPACQGTAQDRRQRRLPRLGQSCSGPVFVRGPRGRPAQACQRKGKPQRD